ncbi:anthranilate synthase family protein [Streptomyces cucumeris]|uniref:anthranilate synthase family protein n=1 Tax=Streptomyces cucumeris TaxID=2962890 RepID=UPI0027E4141A|nr:anthranilate synthase family protein [Streptomyces sp. NEAU-Y11]
MLARVLVPQPEPFALLKREASPPGEIEVLFGRITEFDCLADLEQGERAADLPVLVLLPYRQVGTERGYSCHDDEAHALALQATEHFTVDAEWLRSRLPDDRTALRDACFDTTDEAYAATVGKVISEEIGRGEGANFVIRRSFTAQMDGDPLRGALSALRRLLTAESGAYWTFAVHTGERTLVGASPERHVTLDGGTVTMNPISGTYRYPQEGPCTEGALEFLADQKEADELFMVVDEELKMMARICTSGIRAAGPFLKEMNRLAHTEFLLSGYSRLTPFDILRQTLFAPTVTGSPLENACSVIRKYETTGRGYYSGVAALIGTDPAGMPTLDSAILIRTADVGASGVLNIGVGATLVRHSAPEAEVDETLAKCAALLDAITGAGSTPDPSNSASRLAAVSLSDDARIRSVLRARRDVLAPFWARGEPTVAGNHGPTGVPSDACGHRALLIDNSDTFTDMLAHYLRVSGLSVVIHPFDRGLDASGFDIVVVGPGPGDPRATEDVKISAVGKITRELLHSDMPFMSLCLGHQVLCQALGLPLRRKARPNQGRRRRIDLFGSQVEVGYYNTFAAWSDTDFVLSGERGGAVRICRDPMTGEVEALSGPGFRSFQFHPESVISTDGGAVLAEAIPALLNWRRNQPCPATESAREPSMESS